MTSISRDRARTDRQIRYIVDLLGEIGLYDTQESAQRWTQLKEADAKLYLTTIQASDVIAQLKGRLAVLRAQNATPQVPDGRYAVDNEEGKTAFYRVRNPERDRPEVSVYSSNEQIALPWKTARVVLSKILAAGLQEALERFGRELGICGRCGRVLTDEESRSLGLGPVCYRRSL